MAVEEVVVSKDVVLAVRKLMVMWYAGLCGSKSQTNVVSIGQAISDADARAEEKPSSFVSSRL